MKIGWPYMILMIAGFAAIFWGFPAAHRLKRPLDSGAAFILLAGVLLVAVGSVMTFIPDFLTGTR